MNPLFFFLLLALDRGESKHERHFDKGLLLALALSSAQTGQIPGSPQPAPAAPGASTLDPTTLLMVALFGTDLFGHRHEERVEEIKKLLGLGFTAGNVNANINF